MASTSRLPFSDHRRDDDFMDIDTLDSDTEFAFQLQLQEALTASLATQPSSAARNDVAPVPMALTIRELVQSETELRRSQVDLARAIHDAKVAREIVEISDDEWEECGADFAKPFEAGASSSAAEESEFRLYFKGLVSEELVGNQKLVLAGIGVAICDDKDNLVFEVKKPLIGNGLNRNSAQLKALIEGLTAALSLGLKRITVFCDNNATVQFVNGIWSSKQKKIVDLVNQVKSLQSKFTQCKVTLVRQLEIKFAFKFARDAIESQWQMKPPEESTGCKIVKMTCVICMEDSYVSRMFTVDGCLHRYCFSCMKQHVEVQLQNGILPKCPHADCTSDLSVDSCAKFLSLKHVDTMCQRIKEASIPATERVYCPYPRCSFLMSKSEVLQHSKETLAVVTTGRRRCMKCAYFFCVNCKVPWHKNITCADYKKSNPNPPEEDTKLKSLASSKLWRQCVKCSHMIELLEGCYHMTCRCKYEFCYNCGAEWKNKNPTCKCPLWHEDNILHEEEADSDSDDEYISDEEEEDYEYQSEDEEENKVGGHEYKNDDEDQYDESGSGVGEVVVPEGQIQEQCLDKDFENYISSDGSDLFGKKEENYIDDEDFDGEYQSEREEDNEDEGHEYEDDNVGEDFDGDEYQSEHEEDNEDEGHEYEDDNVGEDFDADEYQSEHEEDNVDDWHQYEDDNNQEDFDGDEYQSEHEEDNADEGPEYEDECVVVEDEEVQEGQIQEEGFEMDMVDHMSSNEDIYFDEEYEEDEVEDYCDFDGCDSDWDF